MSVCTIAYADFEPAIGGTITFVLPDGLSFSVARLLGEQGLACVEMIHYGRPLMVTHCRTAKQVGFILHPHLDVDLWLVPNNVEDHHGAAALRRDEPVNADGVANRWEWLLRLITHVCRIPVG